MGYPDRLLDEGEQVVLDLHPHWKVLVLPLLSAIAAIGVGTFVATVVGGQHAVVLRQVDLAAVLAIVIVATIRPYLVWATTQYVVTNRRVVIRTGVLSRSGRDIPLARINDVSFSHGVIDRMLGCGTLTVESAGERGQVTLTEVPRVEHVQRTVYRLAEDEERRRGAAADAPPQTH